MNTVMKELRLNSNAVLKNRLVMAPMVAQGSSIEGYITQEDLDYFDIRSNVAGMIITGAAAVEDAGRGFNHQIGVSTDKHVEGLRKLAETIKKDDNKAILQLYHGGRESVGGYELFGEVVAPSAIEFPFLDYVPRELKEDEILRIIDSFAQSTKRAIDAGFDGVEIHAANHYLLQQFFSSYSNHRTDKWGGSLENRMRFSLEILKAVKKIVKEHAPEEFIVGFRFCPDEIHGENIGFTLEESIQWIDAVVNEGVDYIHISIWTGYDTDAPESDTSYGKTFLDKFGDKTAVIIVSDVFSLEEANQALEHGHLVAIGRAALIEPQFADKIMNNKDDTIQKEVTRDTFASLHWPKGLLEWYKMENTPLPPIKGIEDIE
ncbi:MAG TPA: NADH-dependent flavin oxidoreductase [Erysipelothrix sp.]|nr:NADH-dependent flavin oxidoreductase [Erysipelothrix sp.]